MNTIAERLEIARTKITNAANKSARKSEEIQLLAVSKTKPTQDVLAAYQAGQRQFGENYVQEGCEKIQALADYQDIDWHFIGPLQSNKTRLVAEHFNWVQTVDRTKIAKRLNEQRPSHLGKLNVCIQINVSAEASKAGIDSEGLFELAKYIHSCDNLRLRGVMAIPSKTAEHEKAKSELAEMNSLFKQLQMQYPSIDTLSMGMSNDLELAIESGSTMVRVGTAIFGARNYK